VKLIFLDKYSNYKCSNSDLNNKFISSDLETYNFLKKKKLNAELFNSFLDKDGHYFVAQNVKKYFDLAKSFYLKDKNGVHASFKLLFQREYYFFLSNFFFYKYCTDKILSNHKNFKIINLLSTKYNKLDKPSKKNSYLYFFLISYLNKKKNIFYNDVKLSHNKNIILKIFFFNIKKLFYKLILKKNTLLVYTEDSKLKNLIKKKIFLQKGITSLFFFNLSKMSILKKIFYYKKIIYSLKIDFPPLDNNLVNSSLDQFESNFNKKDIFLNKIFKLYFYPYIKNELKKYLASSDFFYDIFMKKKPKLFVAKYANRDGIILAEISNLLNFKSILISHASHIVNTNELSMFDWKVNSYYTINSLHHETYAQTAFSYNFLKKIKPISKIVKTKPIILCQISNKILSNDSQKIILHASTPKSEYDFRAINYETEYQYLQNINEQIEIIKHLKNVKMIIKFREYDYLKFREIQKYLIKNDNVYIDNSSSLENLLFKCTHVSSYSSTVIEEGLLSGKDIILYDKFKIYRHLEKDKVCLDNLLESNIHYINNKNQFFKLFNK
jgi:hypothetical protein